MVQWGLQRCGEENYPAYLESTVKAVRLYEKHRFVPTQKITLELDTKPGDREPDTYTETGLLYKP